MMQFFVFTAIFFASFSSFIRRSVKTTFCLVVFDSPQIRWANRDFIFRQRKNEVKVHQVDRTLRSSTVSLKNIRSSRPQEPSVLVGDETFLKSFLQNDFYPEVAELLLFSCSCWLRCSWCNFSKDVR